MPPRELGEFWGGRIGAHLVTADRAICLRAAAGTRGASVPGQRCSVLCERLAVLNKRPCWREADVRQIVVLSYRVYCVVADAAQPPSRMVGSTAGIHSSAEHMTKPKPATAKPREEL